MERSKLIVIYLFTSQYYGHCVQVGPQAMYGCYSNPIRGNEQEMDELGNNSGQI